MTFNHNLHSNVTATVRIYLMTVNVDEEIQDKKFDLSPHIYHKAQRAF